MAVPQSADFDLATAFLEQPKNLAYGLVRGAGNLVLLHELSDKTRVAVYLLGEGPWDSLVRIWINRKAIALPDTTKAHFHPGVDGEIGFGMGFSSTGGDQHVDAFWSSLPGTLDPVSFSRHAYLMLKVPPDPGAPGPELEVLADYQAMKCRTFDASGNQTSFAWTQNPAWWVCDFLIRKFVLREAKANQPLTSAEKGRFDWQSFSDAATYYDFDIGGGVKRFSDGGVVFLQDGNTADRVLEQLLLMCRSYLLERNGKLSLYPAKAASSVFTFSTDNVAPESFIARKSNVRAAANQITASFRDVGLASGSTDDATRFAIATLKLDHEAHQRAVGPRGPGLSVIPKIQELQLDLGNNTGERVSRILQYQTVRQLGDDVDINGAYLAPFTFELVAYEDSLAVEPADLVTIDRSLSEEFGGKLAEVLEIEERPDGTRKITGLEYEPNAFPDTAPAQQATQAPTPGTGIGIGTGVSTQLNPQGSVNPNVTPINIFSALSKNVAGTTNMLQITWSAFTVPRPDQSNLSVPASSSLPTPAAPTLSQVAGGSLAARSRFVRIGFVKLGMIYGISAEASISISANNLLRVSSPASQSGYDGWVPLIGSTSTHETMTSDVGAGGGTPVVPIAFGASYTEPTTGAVFGSSDLSDITGSTAATTGAFGFNLGVALAYVFYPSYDSGPFANVLFPNGARGPGSNTIDMASAQLAWGDGRVPIQFGRFSVTMAGSGSNSTTTGGGGKLSQ